MGALERYLEQFPDTFDPTDIFDPDVENIESDRYCEPQIYKYFSRERRAFFTTPQFRFSQRDVLNDPFEMRRRWNTAKADGLKNHLRERLATVLPSILSDSDLQVELLREQLGENGHQLSKADAVRAKAIAQSDAFHQNVMANASMLLGPLLDHLFNNFEAQFDSMIDATMAKCGVLSLTEDPLNRAMWSYYAGAGTGFVVGLDPEHPFFSSTKGETRNHVLRKVRYTDGRIENFWQNPYYLFLVKNTEYRHECEWRMFKQLADCEQRIEADPPICLWTVPTDMIKSVYFGYAYNPASIAADMAALNRVGASPVSYSVVANRRTGELEATPL